MNYTEKQIIKDIEELMIIKFDYSIEIQRLFIDRIEKEAKDLNLDIKFSN